MLDLNVLCKALTEDASLSLVIKKAADKITVTIIPLLKPLDDDSDSVVTTLHAVLAQPICITADPQQDLNAYMNTQLQALLEARQPAQNQLTQYQAQVAEALNQAKLAEQEAKDKKAKQAAEKTAKKTGKTASSAVTKASTEEVDDDTDTQNEFDDQVDSETQPASTEKPVTTASSQPITDLFSGLGVSA